MRCNRGIRASSDLERSQRPGPRIRADSGDKTARLKTGNNRRKQGSPSLRGRGKLSGPRPSSTSPLATSLTSRSKTGPNERDWKSILGTLIGTPTARSSTPTGQSSKTWTTCPSSPIYKRDLDITKYFGGYLDPHMSFYTGRGSNRVPLPWPQTVGGHRYRTAPSATSSKKMKWAKERLFRRSRNSSSTTTHLPTTCRTRRSRADLSSASPGLATPRPMSRAPLRCFATTA